MERRIRHIMLTATLAASYCTARNLVTNGTFDAGRSAWHRNHASSPGAIALEPREGHGQCIRFTSDGEWVDLGQSIELAPGERCVFQLDMKRTAAGPDIRAFLVVRKKNGQDDWHAIGANQTVLNQWEHLAQVIRPSGHLVSARLLLMNRLEGATAWFDNVQVVPIEPVAAAASGYAPKLAVGTLRQTPTIDGVLSPDEWAGAGRIESFGRLSDGAPPDANTTGWIGHDGQRLLVAAHCEEPNMAGARFDITGHDVGGVFADEVIELFVDPGNDHRTYYHFAVSGAGGDYDSSRGEGQVAGTAYESGWTARAHRGDDGWSVEAAIPFSSLVSGSTGPIWGLNLCRERQAGDGREITAWSATGNSFHAPARFGDIVFAEPPAPPAVTCTFEKVEPLSPGEATVRAEVTNRTDREQRVLVDATLSGPNGKPQQTSQSLRLPAREKTLVELPFTIDQRGEWQAVLSVFDADGGTKLFAGGASRFVVPPVLQARVVRPWYRGRIFSKMDLPHIEVETVVALRETERKGMRLQATLNGEGLEKATAAPPTDRSTILRLPCADLPVGSYGVTVRLVDREGREQMRVDDLSVEKLSPAPYEFWFDRENNLLINGKPHVPTGFYSLDWTGRIGQAAEGEYTLYHTYASQSVPRLDPKTTNWNWKAWLDTGAQAGMRAFMGIGYRGDGEKDAEGNRVPFLPSLVAGDKPEAEKIIRAFIDRWKHHPGIAAWYLYDEPSLAGRKMEEMRYLYELADDIDPYHPKVVCQVLWSDPRFVPWLDVLMPDPYPIRAENSRPLRSVADAVRAARRTVKNEKPVWPVLQWYKYKGGRYPTPTEMRCMAFLAVAGGAKGLTWYSFYHGYKGDKAHWPDVARIGRELRVCEDVILAPYDTYPVRIDPTDAPLEAMTKRTAGKRHVVLVNTEDRPLTDVHVHVGDEAMSATDRLTGTALTLTQGTLQLNIQPYQPLVIDIALKD